MQIIVHEGARRIYDAPEVVVRDGPVACLPGQIATCGRAGAVGEISDDHELESLACPTRIAEGFSCRGRIAPDIQIPARTRTLISHHNTT